MRISRLYTDQKLATGKTIELSEDNAHYVRTVLRLKKDAEIILFNGSGGEFQCRAALISKQQVTMQVGQWVDRSVESPLQVTLGLGISRGDRMDWSVQKAVELGVNHITPILMDRSVVQLNGEKQTQRLLHWQRIAQHAAEQSGRTVVPRLTEIESLSEWVSQQDGLKLILDPLAECTLQTLTPESMRVTLITGPEGGFTDQERGIAIAAGFTPVRLGARILRTETAVLTALAAVQMCWGDFGAC